MTDDSLDQLKLDLNEFIGDEEKKSEPNSNPFSALLGFSKKEKKSDKEKEEEKLEILKKKGIKSDSYSEAYVRNLAIANGMDNSFNIYDVFKKSMGMASFPYGGGSASFPAEGEMGSTMRKPPQTVADRFFGFK